MQFRRSPSARSLDEDWHRGRIRARRNYFSIEQASDVERVKYDLETARIDGSDNPRTYMWRRAIDVFGINGLDVRTLEDR